MVDLMLFLEHTARGMAPIGGFTTTDHRRRRVRQVRLRRSRRQAILGGVVNGAVESIAMSEPEAGSDVATCRAAPSQGATVAIVINGQKTWCSNAHIADHILLVARTGPLPAAAGGHQGMTMFHGPRRRARAGDPRHRHDGRRARSTTSSSPTACCPTDAVVGEVDNGWRQLMAGLNLERLMLGRRSCSAQRSAPSTTSLGYVTQRKQFGKPIGSFQVLRHRIADLATEIECCRLLIYDVAAKVDADPQRMLPREASMVKLKVTETAKPDRPGGHADDGRLRLRLSSSTWRRHVRRTVVSTIYGGTNEIQRDIIGKTYGL